MVLSICDYSEHCQVITYRFSLSQSKAAKKLYAAASVGDVNTMNIVLKRVTGDDINYQNDWNVSRVSSINVS